jgi:hypothetical protein
VENQPTDANLRDGAYIDGLGQLAEYFGFSGHGILCALLMSPRLLCLDDDGLLKSQSQRRMNMHSKHLGMVRRVVGAATGASFTKRKPISGNHANILSGRMRDVERSRL